MKPVRERVRGFAQTSGGAWGSAVRAEFLLGLTAACSLLVYKQAFVRPFALLQYWQQPLLDLQKMSAFMPGARWGLLAGFIIEGTLYFIGWQAASHARGRLAWAIVMAGAVAMGILLLFELPFDAADIFDNVVYGRILAVHGLNPFVQVGAQFPHDPVLAYMGWPETPVAYGPFLVVLAAAVARLAGDGIIANVIAFKLLCGAFLAGSVAMVASILRKAAPERALAGVVLLAWNPIVLFETFGNGHNDIIMVFWILAAIRAMLGRRYTTSILALLSGALVKFIPVLFLPAAGLLALRDLPDSRGRVRFLAVTGAACLALLVAAYGPFWHGTATLGIDRRETLLTTSLPAFLWAWLEQAGRLPLSGADLGKVISHVAAAATALFALWEGLHAWNDRSSLSLARSSLHVTLFYLTVTCLWFQNWYATWILGLLAVFPPGAELALGEVVSFAMLSKPLIFAPLLLWQTPFPSQIWRELRLGPDVMAVPWVASAYAILASWRRPAFPQSASGRPTTGRESPKV